MVTLLLFCLCLGASLPVQASSVSVTDMDVTTVNHTACIPLNQLPDHTIQHVFREYRKIRKVEVHLLGAGEVMVDVSLATGYRDGNLSAPVSQSCGSRWVELERGSVLSFDCIDQDPEGFPAVAAYAKLKSDASNSMALCQIIVTVLDKDYNDSKEIIHATVVITSCLCAVMIMAGIGVFAWFNCSHLLQRDGETGEGDVYFDQPDHDGDPGFDKERAQGELDDDDVRESGDGIADEPPSCHETDDEVFLPGAVTEVDTRPRWLETEIY